LIRPGFDAAIEVFCYTSCTESKMNLLFSFPGMVPKDMFGCTYYHFGFLIADRVVQKCLKIALSWWPLDKI
jgi:hypothetical protein